MLRLLINVMVEGDLSSVRAALEGVVQRYLIQLEVDIEPVAAFERVPGYPTPTMRVGNP